MVRNIIAIGLILSLIASQYLSVFSALAIKHLGDDYLDQDVTLICTGKTFKFVSLSAFQQTGELVFVDAPTDAPDEPHNYVCPSFLSLDKNDDASYSANASLVLLNKPLSTKVARESVNLASPYFLLSSARAPPSSYC